MFGCKSPLRCVPVGRIPYRTHFLIAGFDRNILSKNNTHNMYLIQDANPSINNIVAVDKVHSLL